MIRRRPLPVVSRLQAAVFGLVMAAAAAVLVVPLVPERNGLSEGDVASTTLVAARSVHYESEVLTERAREEAAASVSPVPQPPDPLIHEQKVAQVRALLGDIRAVLEDAGATPEQREASLAALPSAGSLTPQARQAVVALDLPTFEQFARLAEDGVSRILSAPVSIDQVSERVDEFIRAHAAEITSPELERALRETLVGSPAMAPEQRLIIQNFEVDEEATAAARAAARANVAPVYQTYSEGQVIATQGETLDAADIEALRQTGYLTAGFDYYRIAGGSLFALGFGALLAVYLYNVQPFHSPATRRLMLIGFATIAALVCARAVLPALMPDHDGRAYAFALPLAAAAIITASFADLTFGAIVAVAVGMFAAIIGVLVSDIAGAGFVSSIESLELGLAYAAGGLAGAVSVHRAERLGRYIVAAFAVAFATGIVVFGFWFVGETHSRETLGWLALAVGVNGVGSAILAVSAFVLLSMVFGVTTRLQLMELAQSDHPLLRRLQDEAPGTYHHSMMVGSLAERAADSIGADALVARVGSYYHDIGKLAQPRFYVENMLDEASSPHDSLPPERSAAIIREHVTNGLEIATRYRLPGIVRDFIPQHHGTRLVTFFYRKATQAGESVDPDAFRYPGPRPQSKETAIVMLADSCEAIVRANRDRPGTTIDELIDGVIAERLAEGQLDDCDLTMRELQQIAHSFKATLRAIYHPRIAYPQPTQEEIERVARAEPLPGDR